MAWLDAHLSESVTPLLDVPWILDIDTTIKPLYGKQEGAVISYNPHKPGRPSRSDHTYLMARRRLVLRRPLTGEIVLTGEHDGQPRLAFVEADRKTGKAITGYEYAVLVTNTEYEVLSLGPLYRDRADAENAFDEFTNPWGWGGFTPHDLHRCQLTARAVALVYNGWSRFVRLANPEARREAITRRPWLMTSVGRRTEHAGQTTLTLTGLHAELDKARTALLRQWVAAAAEQFKPRNVWALCCDHLKRALAAIGPLPCLALPASMQGNGGFWDEQRRGISGLPQR